MNIYDKIIKHHSKEEQMVKELSNLDKFKRLYWIRWIYKLDLTSGKAGAMTDLNIPALLSLENSYAVAKSFVMFVIPSARICKLHFFEREKER